MEKKKRGFTLIELMVTIAIIGVLAAAAVTRFAGILSKAKESATRAGLTSLRSALNIYYGENTLHPSDDLTSLAASKRYIDNIPLAKLPGTGHPDSSAVAVMSSPDASGDAGGWAYVNDPASPEHGAIIVNCVHADAAGRPWSAQ